MWGLMLSRIIRFRRCSRGISTVIGTIFLVLVALTVSTNVFLWTFTQNATYNQAVKESSQMDADLSSERIVAYNTEYSVSAGMVEVNTTMTAQGALSAQIITVWVTWEDDYGIKYGSKTVDIPVTSGDPTPLTTEVPVPGAINVGGVCNGWLVTARGNRVPLELKKVETITTAQLAQGIGSLAIEFYSFRYFTYNGSNLANYPDGTSSFNVPTGDYVAFGINLTNLDPITEEIVLNQFSELWIYSPDVGSRYCFYIVNVAADGSISPLYSDISIPYMHSKLLIFASNAPGTFNQRKITAINGPCAANLLLLGTIGPRDYGQNIPFVSIYVGS